MTPFLKIVSFLSVSIFISFSYSVADANKGHEKKDAAIVIDHTNNNTVLYSSNADALRYPASLTKLMTAYLVLKSIKSGKISFNTNFKVSVAANKQIPSKMDFKVGSKVSVLTLLLSILVKSANDAAVVLAEGICGNTQKFVAMMNSEAKTIGMTHTHFENPSGVPNPKQVCSARDIATLAIKIFKTFPQYWYLFSQKSFQYKGKKIPTRCKILHWCKGADGAKTGYICASGFNLFVTASRTDKNGKKKRLFVVNMGRPSAKERDLKTAQLLDRYMGQERSNITDTNDAHKKLLEQIDKEDNTMVVDELLSYSSIDKKFIDDLYSEDEVIVEEEIKLKKKTNNRRKKGRK